MNSLPCGNNNAITLFGIHWAEHFWNSKHEQIFVKDNGQGIEEKYLDDVFVPFFTTKESGSGIELALSRQNSPSS